MKQIIQPDAPPTLLAGIEAFLKQHRMPPSRFGRLVAGDPRLVFDLQRGRVPGAALQRKVEAALAAQAVRHD